jgi:hypothetical protein
MIPPLTQPTTGAILVFVLNTSTHIYGDFSMFKIGDKVKWLVRDSNSTQRRSFRFSGYEGVIVNTNPLTAEYQTYAGYLGNVSHRQDFRQLKNGKYIAAQETRDDPKGRLYLELVA